MFKKKNNNKPQNFNSKNKDKKIILFWTNFYKGLEDLKNWCNIKNRALDIFEINTAKNWIKKKFLKKY